MGLFYLITKPIRITSQSATLIDNIFTNINKGQVMSGILMSDISDQLPIFKVIKHDKIIKQICPENTRKNRLLKAQETLNKDLKNQKRGCTLSKRCKCAI